MVDPERSLGVEHRWPCGYGVGMGCCWYDEFYLIIQIFLTFVFSAFFTMLVGLSMAGE